MLKSLQLIPYTDHSDTEISQQAMMLKDELTKMHTVLAEYRVHEAREKYYIELKRELAESQMMEDDLRRYAELKCDTV